MRSKFVFVFSIPTAIALLSSCSYFNQLNGPEALNISGGGSITGYILGPSSIHSSLNHLDETNDSKFFDETDRSRKRHYNKYTIRIQASSPAIEDLRVSSAFSDNPSVAWVESSRYLGVNGFGEAMLEVSILTPLDTKERAANVGNAGFNISIDDGFYGTLNLHFDIITDHDINPPSVIRSSFYCSVIY